MAPCKYLACTAFAVSTTLLWRQASGAVTAAGMTDDCVLAFDLARTARLSLRVGEVTKDTGLETAATQAITDKSLAGADENNCALIANTTPVSADVLGVLLTYKHGENLNCAALLQDQIAQALTSIGDYQSQNWDNGAAAPYNTVPAQNLAYMMFAGATKVGCGATNNCSGGTNVIVCRLQTSIDAQYKTPPFTVDFYKALQQRQNAKVDLAKLTQKDVNTDPTSGSGGGGGSGSGVRGVVPATSILVVSLLGLVSSQF